MAAYKRKDLEWSEELKARQAALDQLGAKPTYTSQNTAALQAAKDKILNREKFSYNVNADALYRQYNDQYTRLGNMAMQDTMGQAAALTGGYGNSYAMTAGQQAYQGYMQELADKVPELEQLAYQRYQAEGDELLSQYGILADAEAQEYSRYQDKLADWYTQRGILADELADAYNREWERYVFDVTQDYTAYRDEVSDERYDTEWQNQVEQAAIANEQWQRNFEENQRQYDLGLEEERRQFDANLSEEQRQFNTENDVVDFWNFDFTDFKDYFLEIRSSDGVNAAREEIEAFFEEGYLSEAEKEVLLTAVIGGDIDNINLNDIDELIRRYNER